ncbi:MAG: hypothetical protein LC720_04980 [Actinobacteria bacterium]|nr:hypothetical protein [Actinomycetota bacterium]
MVLAVPRHRKRLAAAALLVLAAPAAPALGATAAKPKSPAPVESRHLWATVDVCNTKALPRVIGVRGSMPGTGLANERMFMRFQVQYQVGADWKFIPAADTGFQSVGAATFKARQAGHQFTIKAGGVPYVLRGVVTFQWRRRGHAVLKAQRITTAGHIANAGADPPGYSAAACALP